MSGQPVILIEFNELAPQLLDRFMDEGVLPNFRRFYERSTIYVTDAGERDETLMPWIAWPSIHSGMSFADHGVFHLGDGREVVEREIATILSDAGMPVGIFGSMNVNYGPDLRGYYVPDPWDRVGRTHPAWLQPFFDVIASQVKENSKREPLTKMQAVRLALFLMTHGASWSTVAAVLAQLLDERRDPGVFWRRASLLDMLQYDVFKHLNRRYSPAFATFYSNSTAHYQHFFWRNFEPDRFEEPPEHGEHPSYAGAIRYGYIAMDGLIGRFLTDYPSSLLILVTAHSQEPYLGPTFHSYRPRDFEAVLSFAGAPRESQIKPVMAEQFHLEYDDVPTADAAEEALAGLQFDGEPLMWTSRDGRNVFTGCRYLDKDAGERPVTRADGASVPLEELFYRVEGRRSGEHHPDGALWIRGGDHRVVSGRASILDIAPTILDHFDIPAPAYMTGRVLPLGSAIDRAPEIAKAALVG